MTQKNNYWNWYVEWTGKGQAHSYAVENIIVATKSQYQQIEIIENPTFGKMLILDGRIQSAVVDEFIYHEALVHTPLILHNLPQNVVIIGGGEGATLRETLKHNTIKKIWMVDIDEKVIEVSKKYLPEFSQGAFEDRRTQLIFEDGRKFLQNFYQNYHTLADVIIIDIPEPVRGGPAFPLFTKEFYEIVKSCLTENGIVSLQAGSLSIKELYNVCNVYKTLKEVFEHVDVYEAFIPSYLTVWGFIIAANYNYKLPEEVIRNRIKERNLEQLKYYNEKIHIASFILPKYITEALLVEGRVVKDEAPIYI